jgi:hypothetical protein
MATDSNAGTTRLINRARVKQFALAVAEKRAHRFTRVGEEFLLRCEGNTREFIRQYVNRLPSKGKTIL